MIDEPITPRDFVITAKIWAGAVASWLVVTVACTVYTTAKLDKFTAAIHGDHALLLQIQQQNQGLVFDRDIEFRKRLLALQDGLTKLQSQQAENLNKIGALQQLMKERKRLEAR